MQGHLSWATGAISNMIFKPLQLRNEVEIPQLEFRHSSIA